jgi:hypothetical protein
MHCKLSDLVREDALLEKEEEHLVDTLVLRLAGRADGQVRSVGHLVDAADSGEAGNLAGPGLFVELCNILAFFVFFFVNFYKLNKNIFRYKYKF